jgi:hypothetical protein
MGDVVRIGGHAPDGEYCAAVAVNGVWTLGDPPPGTLVASAAVVSFGGAIPEAPIWAADALGVYDVLLLSGECGAPDATILAANDAGPGSGFDVGADPIPIASRAGWLILVALVALLGVWLLWMRRG